MSFLTRRRRPLVRATASAVTLAVVAGLLTVPDSAVAATGYQPLKPQVDKLVPTTNALDKTAKRDNPAAAKAVATPTATAWPGPGSATVAVAAPVAKAGKAPAVAV